MRLAVEEKLRRVQYIRRTPEAARQAAFLNKARQARSRHAPSWFNNGRTNESYYWRLLALKILGTHHAHACDIPPIRLLARPTVHVAYLYEL